MSVFEKGDTYLFSDLILRQSGIQSSFTTKIAQPKVFFAIACVDAIWIIKYVLMIIVSYIRCPEKGERAGL